MRIINLLLVSCTTIYSGMNICQTTPEEQEFLESAQYRFDGVAPQPYRDESMDPFDGVAPQPYRDESMDPLLELSLPVPVRGLVDPYPDQLSSSGEIEDVTVPFPRTSLFYGGMAEPIESDPVTPIAGNTPSSRSFTSSTDSDCASSNEISSPSDLRYKYAGDSYSISSSKDELPPEFVFTAREYTVSTDASGTKTNCIHASLERGKLTVNAKYPIFNLAEQVVESPNDTTDTKNYYAAKTLVDSFIANRKFFLEAEKYVKCIAPGIAQKEGEIHPNYIVRAIMEIKPPSQNRTPHVNFLQLTPSFPTSNLSASRRNALVAESITSPTQTELPRLTIAEQKVQVTRETAIQERKKAEEIAKSSGSLTDSRIFRDARKAEKLAKKAEKDLMRSLDSSASKSFFEKLLTFGSKNSLPTT